ASGGRSAQGNGLGGAGQLSVADVAAAHLSAAAGGDVSSRVDWNGTRTGWVIVAAATCLADSGRGRAGRPAAAWWAALGADDAAFDPLRAAVVAAASRCAANPVGCSRRSARNTARAPGDVHTAHRLVRAGGWNAASTRGRGAHAASGRYGGASNDAAAAAGAAGTARARIPSDRSGADADSSQHRGSSAHAAVDAVIAGFSCTAAAARAARAWVDTGAHADQSVSRQRSECEGAASVARADLRFVDVLSATARGRVAQRHAQGALPRGDQEELRGVRRSGG